MVVGVAGLGLIGGSVGLAMRNPANRVIGFDPDPAAIEAAISRQCIDEAVELADLAQADIVFVACPPDAIVTTLGALAEAAHERLVITDCCSVKSEAIRWAKQSKFVRFVPGHPMAGHEKSGSMFSSAWMFRQAKWILCPLATTDRTAIKMVEEAAKSMGAVPVRMKPEAHDRQVAVLSHLPHVLAAVLVRIGYQLESVEIGAGSWKDLTRVGGVDPNLWADILLGNAEQVSRVLDQAAVELSLFRTAVEDGDRDALRELLAEAARLKGSAVREPAKPRLKPRSRPRR